MSRTKSLTEPKTVSIKLDAPVYTAVEQFAAEHYEGNISMAIRRLVEIGLAARPKYRNNE